MRTTSVKEPIEVKDQGSMVENISSVCRLACKSQLSPKFFEQVGPNLEVISPFLGLTEMESVIFCVILNINLTSESVDLLDIARLLDCSPIVVYSLRPILDSLLKKRLIRIAENNTNSPKNRQRSKLSMIDYYISDDLLDSICSGEKFKLPVIKKAVTNIELFALISEQFQGLLDGVIPFSELTYSIQDILESNSNMQFMLDLERIGLDDHSRLLFLAICCEFIDIVDDINLSYLITLLYNHDFQNQARTRKSFLNNTNPLLEKGLIKIDHEVFRCTGYAELSEESINMLRPNRCDGKHRQ